MLLCLGLGCGYSLLRPLRPFSVHRIAVYPFSERGPIGLSDALAAELAFRLAASGMAVTTDASSADGVLSGQLAIKTLPGATLSTVQLYNVDATATAELSDPAGEVLWHHEVTVRESFLPPDPGTFPEPMTIETRRRLALARLSDRLADAFVSALRIAAQPALAP